MVRCKFKCIRKTVQADGSANIEMAAVCYGSEENQRFFKYTPNGQFSFYSVNPAASEQIEEGKEYYLDISPAAIAEPAADPVLAPAT